MIGQVAVRRFPALTVSTPRTEVRGLTAADAEAAGEIFADKLTRRWLPLPDDSGPIDGHAWCTELARQRRDSGEGDHYAVVRREDDQMVGSLWTRRTDWGARLTEISYAMAPHARGFGFAVEAVDAVAIALILEHGFQRVELRVAPGNLASRRVAEKAGFSYEGLLRNAGLVGGSRVDLELWSFVAADLR
ncbi:GNAT family N-acetyltransferase [Micromonospora chokoriensis]|uniref:Protein N-acetyltransferase, RimJ/RimL family n=1 Tax=Micromonospora chokoriensis TaxID=356851 RepID=A0A1C4WFT4_9ACTN|nr:GNAT family protein [Micromonospora chokoriensis]SCE94999.1 Protein N-acetyltransferase, RimJ/RimL family [Micromonospora chokoriensis]